MVARTCLNVTLHAYWLSCCQFKWCWIWLF